MIGQRVLSEALYRGHEVTEQNDDLTVETGDITDPATVTRLAEGAHAVIAAVSQRGPGLDQAAAYHEVGESLISGLRALDGAAPPVVIVGGAGSLEVAPGQRLVDQPGFPDAYKPEALAHAELLTWLRGITDVQWSYASPSAAIAPGDRTGKFREAGNELISDAEGKSFISAEDFAIALVNEAESGAHIGERFTVGY
jgi:putative NADH-flavin reductase